MREKDQSTTIMSSERLYLREISQDDLPFLVNLHQDPEVMRYIGPPRSEDTVRSRINKIITCYQDCPGYGIWMGCQKMDDRPIGWYCLKDLDGSEHKEIGYRLATEFWGKGYATEMSKELIGHGFLSLDLEEVTAVTHPDNVGSIKVIEKVGMTFRKLAYFYECEVVFYSILRKEWNKKS